MSNTPSDEDVLVLAQQHLKAFAKFVGAGEVWFEGEVEFARAVLAKWGTPQPVVQEPFCYVSVNKQGDITRTMKRKDKWTNIPLYTTPQPTQAQAGAVPLTIVQIEAAAPEYSVDDFLDFNAGVRFAERHHGIKGGHHA